MKSPKSLLVALMCACGLFAGNRAVASAFVADVDFNGTPINDVSYSSSDALFNAMTLASLQSVNAAYTGIETVTVNGDYRGVAMTFFSEHFNPTEIHLEIPSLNIVENFTGGTREEAAQALFNYLTGSGLLSDLSQELAKSSPTDPVAGNPNSLMSTMAAAEYEQAFTNDFSNISSPDASVSPAGTVSTTTASSTERLTQLGMGLELGSMNQGGTRVRNITVPLSYSIRNDIDPRRQLLLRMPITILDVEGAKAYHVGLGASYRFPMNASWTLVPSFSYAVTASSDLGSAAQLLTGGVTSTYYWRKPGYDVGIGNMLGYITTLPFSYQGYDYDPDISNTVLRNGVMWSVPKVISGRKMYLETSVTDTRYFGSELYADNYQELRFSLGTSRSSKAASVFRAGVALRHMRGDTGYNLEFGYWF